MPCHWCPGRRRKWSLCAGIQAVIVPSMAWLLRSPPRRGAGLPPQPADSLLPSSGHLKFQLLIFESSGDWFHIVCTCLIVAHGHAAVLSYTSTTICKYMRARLASASRQVQLFRYIYSHIAYLWLLSNDCFDCSVATLRICYSAWFLAFKTWFSFFVSHSAQFLPQNTGHKHNH